jgi:Domain of unknown function (DUF1857)
MNIDSKPYFPSDKDGVEKYPEFHRNLFGNKTAVVVDVIIPPATREEPHTHGNRSVMFIDQPTAISVYLVNETNQHANVYNRPLDPEIPRRPLVQCMEAESFHFVANNSADRTFRATRIELKPQEESIDPKNQGIDVEVTAGSKLNLENKHPEIEVWDIPVHQNQRVKLETNDNDCFLICDPGTVMKVADLAKTIAPFAKPEGELSQRPDIYHMPPKQTFFLETNQNLAEAYLLAIKASPQSYCVYKMPVQEPCENTFLKELITRGHHLNESFGSIRDSFAEKKSSYHQFQFKYPLKDREHAQVFAKVLQIKAQEAHRFVPAIALSQFISPNHLGFLREITIGGGGPTIQENVLIDRASNSVIFIEEAIKTAEGIESGEFAAINRVIEENGQWYFAGTYLYNDNPSADKINERIDMFAKTYENMMSFIEKEDVQGIYDQLKKY